MTVLGTVQIREVGPRDGFQNEPEVIPTERKVELIDMLARTGLRRLEVTSFVRPDVIAQLADAADVLARIDVPEEVAVSVLIPNERGLERALELRDRLSRKRPAFDEINVFLSASETHNRHNVNCSVEESLVSLEKVLPHARAWGLRCEGIISTSFGCPYEGHVLPERVLEIATRLRDAGAQEIGFGDTTGMANPAQVRAFFERAFEGLGGRVGTGASGMGEAGAGEAGAGASGMGEAGMGASGMGEAGAGEAGMGEAGAGESGVGASDAGGSLGGSLADDVQLTAHFHNTRGQGLANVLASLQAGVTSFESSFGELGGCPVPAGATGNIATEDLVSMLHEMGVSTGIDLDALLACARRVQEVLDRRLGSHTLVAGPVDWH